MTVLNTPQQIALFALASQRAQLKLEKLGMKSSGGPLRPRLAASLGLKPRDPYERYIAKLTDMIEAGKAELARGA